MAEDRFARTAERFVAQQDARAGELAERVRAFLGASGGARPFQGALGVSV